MQNGVPVAPAETLRAALAAAEVTWQEQPTGTFVVDLPGERKLSTTCMLRVGEHAISVHAFVARRPDENAEGVYRYLLTRNLRMYGVAFCIDHHGDIYLTGKLAPHTLTGAEVDRILGAICEYADSSFNQILELGFASSIRKEWAWRTARGESTRNLAAFTHLLDDADQPPGDQPPAQGPPAAEG